MRPASAFALMLSTVLISRTYAVNPIHVPMIQLAPIARGEAYYLAASTHLLAKYKRKLPLSIRTRDSTVQNQDIPMINQQDTGYLATVAIGTPPQLFNLELDTGSSLFWVASAGCTGCTLSAPPFQLSQSSTVLRDPNSSNVTVGYSTGSVSGILVQDTVALGVFDVANQTFVSVSQIEGSPVTGSATGVMGLAFGNNDATVQASSFWQGITTQNVDDGGVQGIMPEMSFCMTRRLDLPSANESQVFGGFFTLGGSNTSLYDGAPAFLNISEVNSSLWNLNVTNITVQGQHIALPRNSSLAAIDTGVGLIGGPTNEVKAIYSLIAGSKIVPSLPGYYSFPCNTIVNVSIFFGGTPWPIDPRDMVFGPLPGNSSECIGSIVDIGMSSNTSPPWVMGNAFLKNVYTIFRADPPSIGFAPLSSLAMFINQGGVPEPSGFNGTNSSTSAAVNDASGVSISGARTVHIVALISFLLQSLF